MTGIGRNQPRCRENRNVTTAQRHGSVDIGHVMMHPIHPIGGRAQLGLPGLISSGLAAEMRGGGTSGLADRVSTSPLPYHWNSRSKPVQAAAVWEHV